MSLACCQVSLLNPDLGIQAERNNFSVIVTTTSIIINSQKNEGFLSLMNTMAGKRKPGSDSVTVGVNRFVEDDVEV